jgi:transposase
MLEIEETTRVLPVWKHAIRVLVDQGLPYGRVLTKKELSSLFGLKEPQTAAEQISYQMEFLQQFTELRAELLEEHRLMLRTMHGESSYEVVEPREQTELAMREGMRDLKQATRKLARGLAFIRHEELSDEERRKNADAQAKAAMLAGMIRQPRLK